MDGQEPFDVPIDVPIDGELDLHTFRPAEVKGLIVDYLEECRKRGILRVRIVHGKGSGQLRRTVHAVLGRLPGVASFRLAGADGGGWGATLVESQRAARHRVLKARARLAHQASGYCPLVISLSALSRPILSIVCPNRSFLRPWVR